jgi:hypothetical protein
MQAEFIHSIIPLAFISFLLGKKDLGMTPNGLRCLLVGGTRSRRFGGTSL